MSDYLAEHWMLSIIVTILLGALGSALWDSALKPISRKLGAALFTAITFGRKRARDKIYKSAAMGHHELPSLYIMFIGLAVGTAFLFASQLRLYVIVYAPEVLPTPINVQCAGTEKSKLKECIKEQALRKVMPIAHVGSLLAIFITVVMFYRFGVVNRTNLITTYYEQCLKAVGPFLDDRNRLLIEQQYALMTTKEQYDAIIGKLHEVAMGNEASLPDSYI